MMTSFLRQQDTTSTTSSKNQEEEEILRIAAMMMVPEEEEEEEEIMLASSSRKRALDSCSDNANNAAAAAEAEESSPLFADAPPETASTPITNHFDSVLECLDFLRMVEEDDQVQKHDVIDAIRGRLHNMISKILLGNTITSMSMLGWRLE